MIQLYSKQFDYLLKRKGVLKRLYADIKGLLFTPHAQKPPAVFRICWASRSPTRRGAVRGLHAAQFEKWAQATRPISCSYQPIDKHRAHQRHRTFWTWSIDFRWCVCDPERGIGCSAYGKQARSQWAGQWWGLARRGVWGYQLKACPNILSTVAAHLVLITLHASGSFRLPFNTPYFTCIDWTNMADDVSNRTIFLVNLSRIVL